MNDKQKYRTIIDQLDDEIMKLIDKRINIAKEIGITKLTNNEKITDKTRELQVFQKTNKFTNSTSLQTIYQTIINETKKNQNFAYFLVGKSLNYSLSKTIHEKLGNTFYNLYETDDFKKVLDINFNAINVTNPYKKEAYHLCDKLSPIAKETNSVNTIIKYNNEKIGFNTDYLGFINMIKFHQIKLLDSNVAIVGNGGTKNTIINATITFNPKCIKVYARNPKENEQNINDIYNDNPDIIINITSYNVYPHFETTPLIDTNQLTNLKTIIDINYNPARSILGLNKNIKYYNGLYMLISQAEETEKLIDTYFQRKRKPNNINNIYQELLNKQKNLIIIGMPYSGKTTLGLKLSKSLNLSFYDTDEILLKENHSLETILNNKGTEETYRNYENELMEKLSTNLGSVISLGGGAIKNSNSMTILSQNGIIIYLDIPLTTLISRIDHTRPLIKNENDLVLLYKKRQKLYQEKADIIVRSENIDDSIKIIKEFLHYDDINN